MKILEPVLKGLEDFIIDFVDDWMCRSDNFDDHMQHLQVLFERIRLEGITINFDKVEFCRYKLKFLGHIITPQGIKPDPDKVQGIHDFTPPNTVKQLCGFLGVVQFCSKYTHLLAEYIAPLLHLTRKNVKWKWGTEEQHAFERIKTIFSEEILLNFPSLYRPFVLFTDASSHAIGSALLQETENGELKLISLASRTLKGAELNYFTSEQELLGIVWSLQKYRTYLLRAPVKIRTDHQALNCLRASKFMSGRLMRWGLAIQEYDYTVEYIKGSDNIIADTLSRIGDPYLKNNPEDALIALILARKPNPNLIKQLKNINVEQRTDKKLLHIIEKLEAGEKIRDFILQSNVLLKGSEGLFFLPVYKSFEVMGY